MNIRGTNIELTPSLREYAESKVGKLEKYFNIEDFSSININLKVINRQHIAEVNVIVEGEFLRAEENTSDMYAALDKVADKLERQVRKYKTRVNRKQRLNESSQQIIPAETWICDEPSEDDIEIVKSKKFTLKPMDAEEAVLQMNMLDHDFFVFLDSETDRTSVVYRRSDGRYGLIEQE